MLDQRFPLKDPYRCFVANYIVNALNGVHVPSSSVVLVILFANFPCTIITSRSAEATTTTNKSKLINNNNYHEDLYLGLLVMLYSRIILAY